MDSMLVLPLTEKNCAHFWVLGQAEGAVVPGTKCGGGHLEVAMSTVHIHRSTVHPPLHRGCGDPMEGTTALQYLLYRAEGVKKSGRFCGEGGSEVRGQGSRVRKETCLSFFIFLQDSDFFSMFATLEVKLKASHMLDNALPLSHTPRPSLGNSRQLLS